MREFAAAHTSRPGRWPDARNSVWAGFKDFYSLGPGHTLLSINDARTNALTGQGMPNKNHTSRLIASDAGTAVCGSANRQFANFFAPAHALSFASRRLKGSFTLWRPSTSASSPSFHGTMVTTTPGIRSRDRDKRSAI